MRRRWGGIEAGAGSAGATLVLGAAGPHPGGLGLLGAFAPGSLPPPPEATAGRRSFSEGGRSRRLQRHRSAAC
jgi:hypothetical protein